MTKYIPAGPEREKAVAQIREQEQDFNLWLIEQERKRMHDLSRDIPLHLRAANSIWPSCQLELDARRLELDKAIAACWMLMDELQYVAEALPADFNKFTKLALKIEELVNKIKALRKSDAKRFKQMEGKRNRAAFVCGLGDELRQRQQQRELQLQQRLE